MTGDELLAKLMQLSPDELALDVFSECDWSIVQGVSVQKRFEAAVDAAVDVILLEP